MIGLGIAWASMLGIPYIMVASMVPKERACGYMGIVNTPAYRRHRRNLAS
jgi:maltose/moltooligosaccharide transporter